MFGHCLSIYLFVSLSSLWYCLMCYFNSFYDNVLYIYRLHQYFYIILFFFLQITNPRFLLNNTGPSAKMAKVTIDLTENGQEGSLSRTGQHNPQPPSQAYIQQSVSSPVLARRIKLSASGSSVSQQPRLQRAFGLNRQQVKSVTNLHKNQNSLHLSSRTQEQHHQPMKMRHLTNSLPSITKTRLPTSSQVILHEALQEPGNYISQNDQTLNRGQDMSENTMPYSSAYIPKKNQPSSCGQNSQNSSSNEYSVSDDSALPMDYKKFFEEASKLPRMGCDVFVLVSYPGCKPAYWGTEKYVKKFENSEHLLPFSASGCLSIRLNGVTDTKNLLANNLDLSQPIQRQLNEVNSSITNPDPNIIIKEESRENNGDENSVVAQDIVKQEHSDTEDGQPLTSNCQAKIEVTAQRPSNRQTDFQSSKNNSALKRKYGYKKQLNTTGQYEGTESYDFSTESSNCLSNQLSQSTNFYDKALVYKDEVCSDAEDGSVQSPHTNKEHPSTDEAMLRLPPEIVEPNRVLIKIEPQTDDYGELNSLVYTEYGWGF